MGDRELLEWAARAAGIKFSCFDTTRQALKVAGRPSRWNPLTDDGDALRLAVKLGIGFSFDRYSNAKRNTPEAEWFTDVDFHRVMPAIATSLKEEKHGADPYAATRRAITRAAAEIGKATAPAGEGGDK